MGRHTQKAKPVQGVSLQKITKQTWRNNYKTTCSIHNIKLNTMTRYNNINGHINGETGNGGKI